MFQCQVATVTNLDQYGLQNGFHTGMDVLIGPPTLSLSTLVPSYHISVPLLSI